MTTPLKGGVIQIKDNYIYLSIILVIFVISNNIFFIEDNF